jgi:hypothetical protein
MKRFGHFEADECASMNEWLAAAPRAELMHGMVSCRVSVADMADRVPRVLADQQVIDIGGKRLLETYKQPQCLTNTRDDKVETKFWKDSYVNRRCLVPATAFCEALVRPQRRGGAPAVRFPRHLPAMEGADQEEWPERRRRSLILNDDASEHTDRDYQS